MKKNALSYPRAVKHALRAGAVGLVIGALTASNACTVFVNHDAHQCETTDDCARFAGTVCSERHVCVLGETACLHNTDCIDRYGAETYYCKKDVVGGGDTGKPLAYSDAGTCASLLSDQCTELFANPGDLRNDDTVILGSHLMPSWFPVIKGGVHSIDMARKDFMDNGGGLLPVRGATKPRPIVFVSCDVPFGDQPQNHLVTDHFIDVGLPGSIGPLPAEWMSYYLSRSTSLETTTARGGPMFITTGNKFEGFESLPGTAGLFFSIGLAAEERGQIYAAEVDLQEKRLRATGFTGDAKVAFLAPGTSVDTDVNRAFRKAGRWNNKSTAENGDLYKEFAWGDTSLTTDPQYIQALESLIRFQPNIVICDGGVPCSDVPRYIESSGKLTGTYYAFGQEGEQAPMYQFIEEIEKVDLAKGDDLRKRIIGVHPGRNEKDVRFNTVKQRHLLTYHEEAEAQGFGIAVFDLAYQLMYAAAAVGDEPLTGPAMGRAIQTRFKRDGFVTHTWQSPTGISKALQALKAGQNLYIDGGAAEGVYNADGTVIQKAQVWCIRKFDPKEDPNTNRFSDAGIYFDPDTNTLKVDTSEGVDGINTKCMDPLP